MASLKRAMELVEVTKKQYQCSICAYSCSQEVSLINHIASVHEKNNEITNNNVTIGTSHENLDIEFNSLKVTFDQSMRRKNPSIVRYVVIILQQNRS